MDFCNQYNKVKNTYLTNISGEVRVTKIFQSKDHYFPEMENDVPQYYGSIQLLFNWS